MRLQQRLNPSSADRPQHYHGGAAFRLGDRVQQVRNNLHRGENGIFNGSSGTISAVDSETHQLTVTFHGGEVVSTQGRLP